MIEIWKDVKGAEGAYQVSNLGNVRSLDRTKVWSNGKVDCEYFLRGQQLKPFRVGKLPKQYLAVRVNRKQYRVHRLVAMAFIANPNNLPEVNHIDGNKENNAVSNLEWCDCKYNSTHAIKNGLVPCGERAPGAKLTFEQVAQIREKYKKGDSEYGAKPLARKYGVTATTIKAIVEGRKWKYVRT